MSYRTDFGAYGKYGPSARFTEKQDGIGEGEAAKNNNNGNANGDANDGHSVAASSSADAGANYLASSHPTGYKRRYPRLCCVTVPCLCCCASCCQDWSITTPVTEIQTDVLSEEDLLVLRNMARNVIKRNTLPHREGPFLVAGRYQYRSMWSRDFSQASMGLLIMGEHELVARQILAIVRRRNIMNLVPKGLDTKPLEKRVVQATIRSMLGLTRKTAFVNDYELIALHKDVLVSFLDWPIVVVAVD